MGQGIGFKDDDGSFGFKLTDDGKVILGNTSDDLIQVTGTLDVNGTLLVSQYIKHKGDANTWINFTDNRIRLNAGGNNFIDCEDPGSAPHKVRINNGGNNIDFVIKDNSNNVYFTADASTSRVGISKADPDYELDVNGTIGATEITASSNISGSAFYGDGTNLTNGGQLISQTIIDGYSTTFSCETNSSTYKQINDDTTAAKVASITFTVPASRKVLVTMTVAVRDFDASSQLFRVRITDSNSESTEGSWGSAWNDEQISGHYATDFFNHTFQWYFDGTVSPHSWSVGDSKTMYFQLKVDGTDETVSLKAGNNYAPLVISAITVPAGVSFVDMDS